MVCHSASTGAHSFGWIIVDKPIGMTSMAVTRRIKRITGSKKVGHAGTLDPLASGILPVALESATRLIPDLMTCPKHYDFTVEWGTSTTTDDCLGDIIASSAVRPTPCAIEAALPAFTGTIDQMPPQFCAAKINGVPAYTAARKGQSVALSSRRITVHQLTLTHATDHNATFSVVCGTGTYVRSLARDIAVSVGTLGHVTQLRRTWVGPFSTGHTMDDLDAAPCWTQHMMDPAIVFSNDPHCVLSDDLVQLLWNGQMIPADLLPSPLTTGKIICYDEERSLVAIGWSSHDGVKPMRCFIGINGKRG